MPDTTGSGKLAPPPLACAPVVFFVFNRPEYTRRVFATIRAARPARLLVVADGPRENHPDEAERCREVRHIVAANLDWPCELLTEYAARNLGCRERIASGLHWAFGHVEAAIIVEDDCLPDPTFFSFCTELLERYRADDRIGMIAGTNYRAAASNCPESYFFSGHFSIWGWATWRRAVAGYDPAMTAWRRSVHPQNLRDRWADGPSRLLHTTMFDVAVETALDSWDVAWSFHLAARQALCAVPSGNLVSNIGVEGVRGRSSDANNALPIRPLMFPLVHPEHVEADRCYDRLVAGRHRIFRDWLRAKWSHRARRFFSRTAPKA